MSYNATLLFYICDGAKTRGKSEPTRRGRGGKRAFCTLLYELCKIFTMTSHLEARTENVNPPAEEEPLSCLHNICKMFH